LVVFRVYVNLPGGIWRTYLKLKITWNNQPTKDHRRDVTGMMVKEISAGEKKSFRSDKYGSYRWHSELIMSNYLSYRSGY
jgi:hypothetical protein